MEWLKHHSIYIFIIVEIFFIPMNQIHAKGKLDISTGYYSFQAETDNQTKRLSNAGVYRVMYRSFLFRSWEFGVGYSILLTKIYTGDMSYGPDLGIIYYPISQPDFDTQATNATVWISELYRPFLVASFHQRQFQSVQSSYAGFGVSGGTEYIYSRHLIFKGEIRYMLLSGPQNFQATEMDLLLGITLPF